MRPQKKYTHRVRHKILLEADVAIKRDENRRRRPKRRFHQVSNLQIRPSYVVGGIDLTACKEVMPEVVRDPVIQENLHAASGTSTPRSARMKSRTRVGSIS